MHLPRRHGVGIPLIVCIISGIHASKIPSLLLTSETIEAPSSPSSSHCIIGGLSGGSMPFFTVGDSCVCSTYRTSSAGYFCWVWSHGHRVSKSSIFDLTGAGFALIPREGTPCGSRCLQLFMDNTPLAWRFNLAGVSADDSGPGFLCPSGKTPLSLLPLTLH